MVPTAASRLPRLAVRGSPAPSLGRPASENHGAGAWLPVPRGDRGLGLGSLRGPGAANVADRRRGHSMVGGGGWARTPVASVVTTTKAVRGPARKSEARGRHWQVRHRRKVRGRQGRNRRSPSRTDRGSGPYIDRLAIPCPRAASLPLGIQPRISVERESSGRGRRGWGMVDEDAGERANRPCWRERGGFCVEGQHPGHLGRAGQ